MARLDSGKQSEIRGWLSQQLDQGAWNPGDDLPTLRELARQHGCSITPVQRALRQLAETGRVELRHGSGATVLPPPRPWVALTVSLAGDAPSWQTLEAATEQSLMRHLVASPLVRTRLEGAGGIAATMAQALVDPPAVLVLPKDAPADATVSRLAARLHSAGVPLLQWTGGDPLPGAYAVVGGFADGTAALTREVLRRGARRPLRLAIAGWPAWERAKQEGFTRAIGDGADALTLVLDDAPNETSPGAVAWLAARLEPALAATAADAVLAVNDALIPNLRRALATLGHTQMTVAGYDRSFRELSAHQRWGSEAGPEPLSVDRNLPQVGCTLAEHAIALARRSAAVPRETMVQHTVYFPEG